MSVLFGSLGSRRLRSTSAEASLSSFFPSRDCWSALRCNFDLFFFLLLLLAPRPAPGGPAGRGAGIFCEREEEKGVEVEKKDLKKFEGLRKFFVEPSKFSL
jgi:hypothetical protein